MDKQLFSGFFQTIVFIVVALAILFGVFTLVSYLAGTAGG